MTDDGPDRAEDKVGNLRGVLPAGTTLRGYELKSILGQGAFGITYRARDLTLSRDVAIKEYLPTTLGAARGPHHRVAALARPRRAVRLGPRALPRGGAHPGAARPHAGHRARARLPRGQRHRLHGDGRWSRARPWASA